MVGYTQSRDVEAHCVQGRSPEHLMRRTLQLLQLARLLARVQQNYHSAGRDLRRGHPLAVLGRDLVPSRVDGQPLRRPAIAVVQLHCRRSWSGVQGPKRLVLKPSVGWAGLG